MHEQLRMPLGKVVAFLENHGYRYAIIGGIALSQWGVFALYLSYRHQSARAQHELCRGSRRIVPGTFLNRRGNMARPIPSSSP